jgi:hypothetical protein
VTGSMADPVEAVVTRELGVFRPNRVQGVTLTDGALEGDGAMVTANDAGAAGSGGAGQVLGGHGVGTGSAIGGDASLVAGSAEVNVDPDTHVPADYGVGGSVVCHGGTVGEGDQGGDVDIVAGVGAHDGGPAFYGGEIHCTGGKTGAASDGDVEIVPKAKLRFFQRNTLGLAIDARPTIATQVTTVDVTAFNALRDAMIAAGLVLDGDA